MLLVAGALMLIDGWYLLQGGSAVYALLGVFYFLSLNFYVRQQYYALYANFALIVLITGWAYSQDKISLLFF